MAVLDSMIYCIFVLCFMMVNFAGSARSSPLASTLEIPEAQFEIAVNEQDSAPSHLQGRMTWSGLTPDSEGLVCFYLPYEDPEFGSRHGTMGRFESISGSQPQATLHNGHLQVTVNSLGAFPSNSDQDHILRIRLPSNWQEGNHLDMLVDASVPRPKFSHPLDWFFDGFLPLKLPNCETSNLTHLHFIQAMYTQYRGRIEFPQKWTYQGPGQVNTAGQVDVELTGSTFAFALQKDTQKLELQIAGIPVQIFPRSKSFVSLRATVEEMLPQLIERLGPPPFQSLTIVETTEVQRSNLPGIIAINKPSQAFFDKLQVDWINWRHWIMLNQLIKQWYGSAIAVDNPDDNWLMDGLVEFVLLDTLARNQEKWDLFRPIFNGRKPVSFTYLQVAEIFAGMLRQNAPFATLTDSSLQSKNRWQDQHSLLFIKQAFALRQIAEKAGHDSFFAMLRAANRDWIHKKIAPKDFYSWVDRRPSPFSPSIRQEIKSNLLTWWTSEGWPDFKLTKFSVESLKGEKWVANIESQQLGEIDFAPSLIVTDDTGASYSSTMRNFSQSPGAWTAEVVTRGRPISATIDPDHVTFDSNRFDNSSESPDIVFFPGTTNTLRDDAYTILWVPYPVRRPGEAFSVGIGASIRHYLESGLSVRFEYAHATRRGSYFINQEIKWPGFGLSSNLLASHTYFNDRRIEASVARSPLFAAGPRLSVTGRLRRKGEAGKSDSDHYTLGFLASIRPPGVWNPCQPSLVAEWEKAPDVWAPDFSYERNTATALGSCLFPKGTNLRIRGFAGDLTTDGIPPLTAQFRPNDLYEVGLRLDSSVTRVNKIIATQADLYLPLFLPLPRDMLILPRQMKWRLFHDFGKSPDAQVTYRSAGMGFFIPFGGDLSGAGSLTVSRISLLAILYQKVGAQVSRRPSIVFDLTGEI